MRRFFNRNFVAAAGIMAAVILYGSLYPFAFREPPHGSGPLRTLLETWANRPGRGDFLSNVMLYAPLGFFGMTALRAELSLAVRLVLVVFAGTALAISVELAQYYEIERVVNAQDVYANTFGTAVGAIVGSIFGLQWRSSSLRQLANSPFPSLILADWLGYQLFPYVPSVDVHEKWLAVKPLFVTPNLAPYDLFRYTASWVVVCALLEAIFGRKRSLRLFPVFAAGLIVAKILISSRFITWAQLIGPVAGFVLWFAWPNVPARARIISICVFVGIYVVSWRLAPFHFSERAGAFVWIPFFSMMHGSVEVNVESFLEKVFYYGSSIWLLTLAGVRLRMAAVSVALLLLATSMAEVFLPGRSAETTDAAMALLTAVIAASLTGAKSRAVHGTSRR